MCSQLCLHIRATALKMFP